MRDIELAWYQNAHRPDGVRCDRNGCRHVATVSVSWPRYSTGYRACIDHAGWWGRQTGPVLIRHLQPRPNQPAR